MVTIRFSKDYLSKDKLHAWILANPVKYTVPVEFTCRRGCQVFMPVSQDWWKDVLKELQPSKPLQPLKLLILLTAEEVDDILQGQQTYLLKAQVPANLGRVHLCVRSLDYAILGTVNFAGIQTFSDAKAFTRWADTNLSQGHVERSNAILKSLNQKKTIAAISLEHPEECKEKVFYKHGEAWTAYIIVSI